MSDAIGSELFISKEALNAIERADKRLQNIQETARAMGTTVNNAFTAMSGGANMFADNLDKIIQKMRAIGTNATAAGQNLNNSFSNIGNSARDMGGSVTKASEVIDGMRQKLSSMSGMGTGGIQQAALALERLQKSMQNKSGMNIANLKEEITAINSILKDKSYNLTSSEQDELVKRKKLLQDELKYQEQMYQERTVAYQKALDRMASAQQSYESKQRKNANEIAQKKREKNYATNTTYQGALDFSRSANTLNRQALAVKYLEEAKRKLSKTDSDYTTKLNALNAAIEKHNAELNAAKPLTEAARARQAKELERQNRENTYATNTTYKGALKFSEGVNTLNRHAKAIEYLRVARMKLNTTDQDYRKNLNTLNVAIEKHTKALRDAGVSVQGLGKKYSYLDRYISQLIQRTAVLFTFNSAKDFIRQIAEVRGQMEMSQRSLESMLQNKVQADEIFNKTVQLAVKSPFRIKDLVNYTKQLAAYRIENDKLYDTTKRLADVSAGLGVDMSRLILAYGQVKAAAYLRGSEVRQFTEAGINMYGELQALFKERDNADYTTAQIVDMISKRMIKFKDVEQVFQRLTDKGGMFYEMQERQSQTLWGMIQKLGDAFDIMLNEIGKSNEGVLKGTVASAIELLKHWQTIASVAKTAIAFFLAIKTHSIAIAMWNSKIVTALRVQYNSAKLLHGQWRAMGSVISNVVKSTGLLKSLGIGLVGTAAAFGLDAIISHFQKVAEKEREIAQVNREFAETFDKIQEIQNKFGTEDDNKSIEDKKKAFQELITLMQNANFDIKINIEGLSKEELAKQFNVAKGEILRFAEDVRVLNYFTKEDSDVKEMSDKYSAQYTKIISKTTDLRSVLDKVSVEYKNLSKEAQKYYDIAAKPRQDNEDQMAYTMRVKNALQDIAAVTERSQRVGTALPGFVHEINVETRKLNNEIAILDQQKNELFRFDPKTNTFSGVYAKHMNYLKRSFEDTVQRGIKDGLSKDEALKNARVTIKPKIDAFTTQNEIDDAAKQFIENYFGIKINIDKANVEEEVSWIDDYLEQYFKNKKYKINVEVNQLDAYAEGFKSLLERGDKAKEQYEAAKKFLERFGKMKSTRKGWILADQDIRTIMGSSLSIAQKYVHRDKVKAQAQELLRIYKDEAIGLGVDPDEKENKKRNKEREKQRRKEQKEQRDILSERISLLSDMNSKYNELLRNESKEDALIHTRKYFKEAAENVGWSTDDIMPDDKAVADRIRKIGRMFKELTKRGDAFRKAADIEMNGSLKVYEKLRDQVSTDIDEAFAGLDLYKRLKDNNVSETVIRKSFGDLAHSFDDLRDMVNRVFNQYTSAYFDKMYGSDPNKWSQEVLKEYEEAIKDTGKAMQKYFGEEQYKQYKEAMARITKQQNQQTIDDFNRLTSDYKTKLTEQLELDKWYVEERRKIYDNETLKNNPELQKEYLDNLKKQYDKKTTDNSWKSFQESDMYIRLFENLDHASTAMLMAMRDKLQSIKESLKDLDPAQIKQIVQQMEKLDERILANNLKKNPFKDLVSNIKEYVKFAKQREQIEKRYTAYLKMQNHLETQKREEELLVAEADEKYKNEEKVHGADSEEAKSAKAVLEVRKQNLAVISHQLKEQEKITKEEAKQLNNGEKQKKDLTEQLQKIGDSFGDAAAVIKASFEMLEDWGINAEIPDEMTEIVGGFEKIDSSLQQIASGKVITGTVSLIGGIGKSLGGIFGWGTKDKKLEKKIAKHQRAIERLSEAYEKLKESMDDAWSMEDLKNYNDEMVKNIELQNANLRSMIAAEKDKKKTDSDKIHEYEKQLEENMKVLKEMKESLIEQLGGFGSEANYKAAAQAFADAWFDAFKEGSNALDALNEKFEEYIQNLIKKQLMLRVAQKYLKPLLEMVDKSLEEGSDGGMNLTDQELAAINKLGDSTMKQLEEAFKNVTDSIGFVSKAKDNLSDLQQGIQAVTETTAKSLEGLLNGMRYYLATQQADVRIIRDTLLERLGTIAQQQAGGSSNIMVDLLQQQVEYMKRLSSNFESVMKAGHSKGGYGLRVFLN